jgi:hypothetical protein
MARQLRIAHLNSGWHPRRYRVTLDPMVRPFAWLLFLACGLVPAGESSQALWKFAVSGDSRNCGDIVMPAIAAGVRASGAEFYWHLGDFRAIYEFDEDMAPPPQLHLNTRPLLISDYETQAWPDFIEKQLEPFGHLPVFLSMGNHETIPPKSREEYLAQFADWLDTPTLRGQRLSDNPKDHKLRTYYHWVDRNIDFITLDNASPDQFDGGQVKWFHSVLEKDKASSQIRTIVVGMHAALPGSVGLSHSMNDWAQGEKSGRDVYESLWDLQNSAGKRVYVLASHSHFFMEDVFCTAYWKDRVLPGWIVGTAGAVRNPLPKDIGSERKAATDVYGYLLATVMDDGSISFGFQQLGFKDLMEATQGKYPKELVSWCVDENKQ